MPLDRQHVASPLLHYTPYTQALQLQKHVFEICTGAFCLTMQLRTGLETVGLGTNAVEALPLATLISLGLQGHCSFPFGRSVPVFLDQVPGPHVFATL